MSAGAKNVYTCNGCGNRLVTVDRDEGVTPYIMRCGGENPPGCGEPMYSSFYRPEGTTPPATHEWYKPNADELAAECSKRPRRDRVWIRDHVERGGLLIRPIAASGVVS